MVIVAICSLSVLVYTYVGYPILIAVLARALPLRTRVDDEFTPTVTACIPVHNAADLAAAKIETLQAQDYPADKLEILLCSDGSTDDTEAVILAAAEKDPRVRVRFDGKVYPGTAILVEDPAEREGFDPDRFVYRIESRRG